MPVQLFKTLIILPEYRYDIYISKRCIKNICCFIIYHIKYVIFKLVIF